jgi:UPF0716 protein FxsA
VGKLFLLFTIVPLVELYLLLMIGDLVGFWPTVGLVLVTGVVGAWLAKRGGLRVLRKWQAAIAEHRVPEEGVLGGLLILVGGVLLVAPGVLTDIAGMLLLFPPSRRFVARTVRRHVEKRMQHGSIQVVSYGGGAVMRGPVGRDRGRDRIAPPADVIEVEGEVIDVDA